MGLFRKELSEYKVMEVESFTHKNTNQVIVSKKFLNSGEHVLIIDDFWPMVVH